MGDDKSTLNASPSAVVSIQRQVLEDFLVDLPYYDLSIPLRLTDENENENNNENDENENDDDRPPLTNSAPARWHRDGEPLETESAAVSSAPSHRHLPRPSPLPLPDAVLQGFRTDGFAVFPHVLALPDVQSLNRHLDDVLVHRIYDRGMAPTKLPPLHWVVRPDPPTRVGQPSSKQRSLFGRTVVVPPGPPKSVAAPPPRSRVLQGINMHKADSAFRQLVTNPSLGRAVCELMRWSSVRLAQDQVWVKPVGSPPLTFHRDAPYFAFDPVGEVATVWVALDDMTDGNGPLEYARGSHQWGEGRVGSANQFFQPDREILLQSAAYREGLDHVQLVSLAGLSAGGVSIHHGRTWHGSGRNQCPHGRMRRGLGVHYVPGHVRFTSEAAKSRLWKPYVDGVDDPALVELSENDFPLVWPLTPGP